MVPASPLPYPMPIAPPSHCRMREPLGVWAVETFWCLHEKLGGPATPLFLCTIPPRPMVAGWLVTSGGLELRPGSHDRKLTAGTSPGENPVLQGLTLDKLDSLDVILVAEAQLAL